MGQHSPLCSGSFSKNIFTASGVTAMAVILLLAVTPNAHAGLMAADATPNSVTLTWTAPGDDGTTGASSVYDIRYSLSTITDANWGSATQVSGEPTPSVAGSSEQFEVTGLQPSTTYYFAIKAGDEVPNWSELSNIVTKTTTAEETPPATIANLSVNTPTPTSLRITWTAPGDDGNTGTASLYDIRYATFTINDANWNSASVAPGVPAPASAGTSQSLTVSGLSENTTYYFAIKTADEVPNWSGISNVASGTTLEEATPPAVIADLGAVAPTQNSVILSWTAPGDDGNTGTASQYDVRYSTSSITSGNWNTATQATGEPTPRLAGGSEAFTINGLNENTTYYFAVRTADEVPNWSGISNVASTTTPQEDTPPGNVNNLTVIAQTSTTLTVRWTAPGDDGATGTADQYDMRFSTSNITSANFNSATQCPDAPDPAAAGTLQTCQIHGLQPDVTYYVAIKTADEVPNWSGVSNIAIGSTSEETTPPAAIANLGAGSPGEHSVQLNWTAPGDDGNSGTASQYDVRYSTSTITAANFDAATPASGEPAPNPAGSAQSFTVTGLNSSTTYYFAIKSADEVPNWSAISNVVSSSTLQDGTPPQTVATLNAVQPTTSTMTLVWLAPGDDGASGTASQYDVRYSTSPITSGNWGSASQVQNEPNPSPAGTPESLTVTGLAEATTYYFALQAADERPNWSAISNVASNNTSADITPPAKINDLSATGGEEEGTVLLGWTAPGDDGMIGRASAYFVKYYHQPITPATWSFASTALGSPIPANPGDGEEMVVSGLVPGSYYYFAVRAIDDALNTGDLSNIPGAEATLEIILANDDMGQPSYPLSSTVVPTSQPEFIVLNANEQMSNIYRFEVATDSSFVGLVAADIVNQQPGGETAWRVPIRLGSEQDYYWRVGTNSVGYSPVYSFSVQAFAHAFPNPAKFSETDEVTFTELPEGDDLLLVTISGSVVRRWSNLTGGEVTWDGTNESGNSVSSGTYLWYAIESGAKGKLLVVR